MSLATPSIRCGEPPAYCWNGKRRQGNWMEALDAKGLPLSVGDVVLIPCRVTAIGALIEVDLPDTADDPNVLIESRQVVRANPHELDVTSVLGTPA